jgi:hypothetical protein
VVSGSRVRAGTSRRPRRRWDPARGSRSVGQPIDRVEREADGERILDLRARDTVGEHGTHVIRIHGVLARQLAQQAQRHL